MIVNARQELAYRFTYGIFALDKASIDGNYHHINTIDLIYNLFSGKLVFVTASE